MTKRELLDKVDARDIGEWMAFFRVRNDRSKDDGMPDLQKQIQIALGG